MFLFVPSCVPYAQAEEDGGGDVASDEAKLSDVYQRLEQIGANSAEARAAVILSGLGFSPEVQVCWEKQW